MRTEQEMRELLLTTAQADERIRAVYLNGSRTNPTAKKDIFQDYDIVYVVKETTPFIEDRGWIDRFGERLYMQYPENNKTDPSHTESCYGWLMQFADGIRLDLHVHTAEYAQTDIKSDALCEILLDKDKQLPEIPEATDRTHWVRKPSQEQFSFTCNEFWWCLNNVGKGLWREEIPYVQDAMNHLLRPQLLEMLSWKIGCDTDFSCSIGKSGKEMWKWLGEEEWHLFLRTYANGRIEEMWKSVKTMSRLFEEVSQEVSERLGLVYNSEEAHASFAFLLKTEQLPRDAKEI